MSSTWGNRVKLSIYGESHGTAVGAVLDGIRAGEVIDETVLREFMARRASVDASISTPRKEADLPEIVSGLNPQGDGKYLTTGAPIHLMIRNLNTRSQDYSSMTGLCRPGHADFTGAVKYKNCNITAGGGHFSGRLTAALTAAGGICRQILSNHEINVFSHILSIGDVYDLAFDPVNVSSREAKLLSNRQFAVIDESKEAEMRRCIQRAMAEKDSVGGVVECAVIHLPVGLGDPIFDGMESRIASIVFGIPAVKGIEFGNGFDCCKLTGRQNNDEFYVGKDGTVQTKTNHHGGILGGITSGMPLVFRVVMKPTPTVGTPQNTVDLRSTEDAVIEGRGRHDPCIVIRAAACVEAAAAIAVLDALLEHREEL